jgi:hypothetical protein
VKHLLKSACAAACLAACLAACTPGGTNQDDGTVTALGNITTATTLETGKTYTVDGTVTVSAKLTIQPGVTLKFTTYSNYGSGLVIEEAGQIDAEGATDNPITFTSANASPAVGDWGGVVVYGNSAVFSHCAFMYSGNGEGAALTITGSGASVTDCAFASNVFALNLSAASGATAVSTCSFYGNTGGSTKLCPVSINTNVAFADNNTFTSSDGSVKNTYPGIDVSGNVSTTMTLGNLNAPYIIAGAPAVVSATLTIKPGVVIGFGTYSNYGSGISVSSTGKIISNGTSTNHVTFTSEKAYRGLTAAREDWGGIGLEDGTDSCLFNWCDFLYAGNGTCAALDLGSTTNTSVTNCSFTHVVYGIYKAAIGAGTTESGSTFTDVSVSDYAP